MLHKTFGVVSSLALASLTAVAAEAQTSEHALQLGFGTDIITYTNLSADIHQDQEWTNDRSTTRWGFSDRSSLNFEGGYGLGESFVLGGIVQLGGWSQKDDPHENDLWTKSTTFDLLVAPKLDYMFLPGERIRPFLGAAVGVKYFSEKHTTQVNTNRAATRTDLDMSATGLALIARAGVRFFLTQGFSLDPAFSVMWLPTASGSWSGANGISYDMSAHGYTLGLTVAASGWIGL
jgi:opacity protein-like surface antigen